MNVEVRKASDSDSEEISRVVRAAFPGAEGREIDELVSDLQSDVTAAPLLSLVACIESRIVGHVLFTRVQLENSPVEVSASILAPLCVHPDFQGRGIGGHLIRDGLKNAKEEGTQLIFVLGHPGYYRKHGFVVAGTNGFEAPYPIPEEHAEAWMVQELGAGVIEQCRGRVVCADSLMDPKHWQE